MTECTKPGRKIYCLGGPLNDRTLVISPSATRLNVPIQTGPNRGEGDRGYGSVIYRHDGRWDAEGREIWTTD